MAKAKKKKVKPAESEKGSLEETVDQLWQLNQWHQALLNKLQKQVKGKTDERKKADFKKRLLSP